MAEEQSKRQKSKGKSDKRKSKFDEHKIGREERITQRSDDVRVRLARLDSIALSDFKFKTPELGYAECCLLRTEN